MADTLLVIVEQREGKLNRVSYETIAGAQAIAAETGWTLEAAVVGDNVSTDHILPAHAAILALKPAMAIDFT